MCTSASQLVDSWVIDDEAEQLESWRPWAETKISDPTGSMRAIVQITIRGRSPPYRASATVKPTFGLKVQDNSVRSSFIKCFFAAVDEAAAFFPWEKW